MVWFKVDDTFAFHQKCVAAGNAAVGLWVRAGSWCAAQLNDGFVPDHMIASLGTKGQAARLVAVRLWHREDAGYRFHQWNEDGRQPSREEVEAKRQEWRDKKRRQRRDKDTGQYVMSPEVSLGDAPGDSRESPTVPSRPVPSRPISTSVETSGGNATEVDGWRDPNEPPKCHQHRGMRRDYVPDCKPCEHKRKRWEAAKQVQAEFGGDPWCGNDICDPITRRRETRFGSILCPDCHPLADEESA